MPERAWVGFIGLLVIGTLAGLLDKQWWVSLVAAVLAVVVCVHEWGQNA